MIYKINVAKVTKHATLHYFSVDASLYTWTEIYDKLKQAFPEPDYKINVTRWEHTGYPVDTAHLDNGGN